MEQNTGQPNGGIIAGEGTGHSEYRGGMPLALGDVEEPFSEPPGSEPPEMLRIGNRKSDAESSVGGDEERKVE